MNGCGDPQPPLERRRTHLRVVNGLDHGEASRNKRHHGVRSKTLGAKQLTKRELELGRLMYPDGGEQALRPRVRGDCVDGFRPCPFVSCRHHLYLDVSEADGIKLNFPDLEVDELEHSCVLDLADQGSLTLEDVGALLNVTRERIRQIEQKAQKRMLVKLKQARLQLSDLVVDESSGGNGINWWGESW